MKKKILQKYAELIAKVGANVQKNQEVILYAELDQPEFVEMVVVECYKAGASKVTVEWLHQNLTKIHTKYRTLKVMSVVEEWEKAKLQHRVDNLPATIYLISEDPDGLKNINQEKYQKASQARFKIIKPYRDQMENKYQWCIAAVPGEAWAKKIFPKERVSRALELLWEEILHSCRVSTTTENDPIKAWSEHNELLSKKCARLNSAAIKELRFIAANGTDITIGMTDKYKFLGGAEKALNGVVFNANMPSEEVFVSPKKGEAKGVVYSTKPLSYRGSLIENFYLRFEDGKVVESHAEKNDELLKQMLQMDEGAAYLGECALVPHDSPISNSNILFYNTLFDENASCHLALGKGYSNTYDGYENLSLEELCQRGINESMIHEDFMIGTRDMKIIAYTADGSSFNVFENGNWA